MSRALSRRVALSLPALLAAPALAAGGLPHGGENPDAELIQRCAAYIAARAAYNADGGDLECEDDPLWHAVKATEERLEGLTATTLAGVLAKASVAVAEATMPDGRLDFNTAHTGDWPEQVIRDLLRLAEGAQS